MAIKSNKFLKPQLSYLLNPWLWNTVFMKQVCLLIFFCSFSFFKAFAQPFTLPQLIKYKDTTNIYYLSLYEEYLNLFDEYNYDEGINPESCKIDFSKYDLEGIKQNGEWTWKLVSPKKYHKLSFDYLTKYDTVELHWLPYNCIISDSAAFNLLKTKSLITPITDTFDFNTTALIYNDVWVDCNGTFDYKLLYDDNENVILCKLITYYGGSRGMCPKDSWIKIKKPKTDTKIKIQTISLH